MHADTSLPSRDLLTIAELAKRFDLPESTARFYCKRFLDYLPHAGAGKRRRYRPEVLEIFPVLLKAMEELKNASAVEEYLAARFPRNAEFSAATRGAPAPGNDASLAPQAVGGLLRAQTKALQDIAAALERLGDRDREMTRQAEALAQSQGSIQELKDEVRSLRRLQDEAERIHQQDLEQLRKWLSHLAQEQSKGK